MAEEDSAAGAEEGERIERESAAGAGRVAELKTGREAHQRAGRK